MQVVLKNNIHINKNKRFHVIRFTYKSITALTIIIFIGFLIVAPLDILSLAIKKQQLTKFFITIGGIVLVILLNLYWFLYRFFSVKQILKYIPKNNIPIFTSSPTNNNNTNVNEKDHNNKRVLIPLKLYNLTWDTFDLIPHLQNYYNYNNNKVVFNNGVSPPKKTFENFEAYNNYRNSGLNDDKKYLDDLLPFLINYDSIIQAFSQDLKFSGLTQNYKDFVTSEMNLLENKGHTFSDYIKIIYLDCKKYKIDTNGFNFEHFCRLYNKLKYSGRTPNLKSIKEKDFITFMQLTIHFYKIKQELEEITGFNLKVDDSYTEDFSYSPSDRSSSNGSRSGGHYSESDHSNNGPSEDNRIGGERPVFTFESSDDDIEGDNNDEDDDDEDDYSTNVNINKDERGFSLNSRFLNDNSSANNSSMPSPNSRLSAIKVAPIKKRGPSPNL